MKQKKKEDDSMDDELRRELEALSTDELEDIAGSHFMFADVCAPEIRKQIRNKQAAAQEILDSRAQSRKPGA